MARGARLEHFGVDPDSMVADALKVVIVKSGCRLIVEEFLEARRQSIAILFEAVDENLLDLL